MPTVKGKIRKEVMRRQNKESTVEKWKAESGLEWGLWGEPAQRGTQISPGQSGRASRGSRVPPKTLRGFMCLCGDQGPWPSGRRAQHGQQTKQRGLLTPRPSVFRQPRPLFMTPGHHLDKFIKDFLQPNEHFLSQVKQAIDLICKFLRENCFRNSTTKIQKIIKGGSLAKGTALKNSSDADLVVFPDSLKSYTSQKTERAQVLREIKEQLQAYQKEQQLEVIFEVSKWKNPRVLSFSLKSRKHCEYIHVDVLPAFNALGQLNSGSTPDPKVYMELIRLCKSPDDVLGGEFSTCFTELQRNFVLSRPTKLKDLIRLVKHWYQQCERKLKSRGSLPPKYALELLTIYAWEQGSGTEDFDTAEGFRTVLDLVTQYQQLCVFWKVNYSLDEDTMRTFLLAQIQKTRPVILDPAEPTGDVGGGDRWCWHLLAKEAKEWFSSPCFKNGAGYPVEPWKVPVRVF